MREDGGFPAGAALGGPALISLEWLSISLDPFPELPSAWGCRDCLCPPLMLDSGTGLDEDQRSVGAHGDSES